MKIRLHEIRAVTECRIAAISAISDWESVTVLEGLERRRAWKRLRRAERRRRRGQRRGAVLSGRRLDPHGRHKIIVRLTTTMTMGDWKDDKFYSTPRPAPAPAKRKRARR
jgi:hypothetical protein